MGRALRGPDKGVRREGGEGGAGVEGMPNCLQHRNRPPMLEGI